MTLYDRFSTIAASHPNKIAFEDSSSAITYKKMLNDVIDSFEQLMNIDLVPGDRVAVSSAKPYPILVLELACSRLGVTLVFLESFVAPNSKEWDEAVDSSSAHWTVTWSNRETPHWTRTAVLHDNQSWHRPILLQARTSGTTGKSKGVCLSEAALIEAVKNTQQIAKLTPSSRGMLIYEPLGLLSQIAAFSTLLAGATLVDGVAVADTPKHIAGFLEKNRISHLVMVPQHIAATLDDPNLKRRNLSHLDTIMYGAAPVTSDLIKQARSTINCRWLQCYGMTETTGPVCWLANEEQHRAGFSVGREAPGCTIKICDPESGEALPAGKSGDVFIGGKLLMEGYWDPIKRCPEPGNSLNDGWLRTGDLGCLSPDGHLLLQGRASDDIVCALGYTIKPAEIESIVIKVPGVVEAAAFGYEIGSAGVMPIVVCQVEDDPGKTQELIREACASNLDRSKQPTHFVLVDQPLPRGSNGKIQKAQLKKQTAEHDLIPLN